MSHDETMFSTAPPFPFREGGEYEEKDLSASLTLRWSRKRRRWECDNAYFWHEFQNKWCCRSEDGRYYHGFRSLRALLKSYVGGRLCESSCCYSARNVCTCLHSHLAVPGEACFCRKRMGGLQSPWGK